MGGSILGVSTLYMLKCYNNYCVFTQTMHIEVDAEESGRSANS